MICTNVNNKKCQNCTEKEAVDGNDYYWCNKLKKSFKLDTGMVLESLEQELEVFEQKHEKAAQKRKEDHSDKQFQSKVAFKYKNYPMWVVLYLIILGVTTFLSVVITNCSAGRVLNPSNSGISMRLPEGWHSVTGTQKISFISSLALTDIVIDESHLFSNDDGLFFLISIRRGISKNEMANLNAEFMDKEAYALKHKGTNWLPVGIQPEGFRAYIALSKNRMYRIFTNTSDDAILITLNI